MAKLDYLGANVPTVLQDELALLFERGYTPTEIVKEGIRCCSDKEGLMVRRRETAQARPQQGAIHG
jgi:hypothetical protein